MYHKQMRIYFRNRYVKSTMCLLVIFPLAHKSFSLEYFSFFFFISFPSPPWPEITDIPAVTKGTARIKNLKIMKT